MLKASDSSQRQALTSSRSVSVVVLSVLQERPRVSAVARLQLLRMLLRLVMSISRRQAFIFLSAQTVVSFMIITSLLHLPWALTS